MNNNIKENIENPEQLESMYRADRKAFIRAFDQVLPEIAEHRLAEFWRTRLRFESTNDDAHKLTVTDILFLVISCATVGLLIKIPRIFGVDPDAFHFFQKNVGLIVFMGLSMYAFLSKKVIVTKHVVFVSSVFAMAALYINFLPSDLERDSVNLAYFHLPLMLWSLYGLIYTDFNVKDMLKRIDYIKHNGSLVILGALIAIAGGILTGVTIGLFSVIGISIETFYFEYVVVWGAVSLPIVATFVVRLYPYITKNIAPVIAQIFSPLVLITLVVYLIVVVASGKDPYNDRDFLLVFNLLLLGVMAIIVFSVSETESKKRGFIAIILFALTTVTLLVDMVALSAILYRLGEFGFTPNRLAVLGSNLLIFGNLILILRDLFSAIFRHKGIDKVEHTIAQYLPLYFFWAAVVVFAFPLLFGFK